MESTMTILVKSVIKLLKPKVEFSYTGMATVHPHLHPQHPVVHKILTMICTQENTIEFMVASVPAMNVIPVVKLLGVQMTPDSTRMTMEIIVRLSPNTQPIQAM